MAKKIIQTTVTRHDDESLDEFRERPRSQPEKSDPAQEAYSDFMQKFKGARGCRVKVYRIGPRGRQYCFYDTPDLVDEERIRLHHARQSYASEEGQYQIVVEVNGEDQAPFNINVSPQVGTPGAESHPSGNGGMADVVRLLQEQNARLEQRLLQSERTPMIEMVDGLAKLDSLRGTSNNQPPIEAILKAVEIGQKLNAPADSESWTGLLMGVLKENAPMILSTARAMMAARPQAHVVNPPAQVEQPPISEEIPVEQQEKIMLLEVIQLLKRKAKAGSDPNLYVALIDDNREDPLYAKLISTIAENEFSAFVALDPELDKFPNREFFRAIYDGIRSLLVQENSVAADPGRVAGNTPNTSGNGASGKGRGKRS